MNRISVLILLLNVLFIYCERSVAQQNDPTTIVSSGRGVYVLEINGEKHHVSIHMGSDLQDILIIPGRSEELDIVPQQLDEMRDLESKAADELDGLFARAKQANDRGDFSLAKTIKDEMVTKIGFYQNRTRKLLLPHQLEMLEQHKRVSAIRSVGFVRALEAGILFNRIPTSQERKKIQENLANAQEFFDEGLKRLEEETVAKMLEDLPIEFRDQVQAFLEKSKNQHLFISPKKLDSTDGLHFFGGEGP